MLHHPQRERPAQAPDLPASLAPLVQGRLWARNIVGEAGAVIYRLHHGTPAAHTAGPADRHAHGRAGDLYLKHGRGAVAADVVDEAVRLRWLVGRLPVPAVMQLILAPSTAPAAMDDEAWLLTEALPGCTAHQLLVARAGEFAAQAAVVDALADCLRHIHAIPAHTCPFNADHQRRLVQARARLDAGLVDVDDFGDAHAGMTAHEVWALMAGLLPIAHDSVVTHGDFSLDNVLLEATAGQAHAVTVTGCIDLGRAGVADRFQDIAVLWDCLAEFSADLQRHFLARVGVSANDTRLRFHLALDEFF